MDEAPEVRGWKGLACLHQDLQDQRHGACVTVDARKLSHVKELG